MATAKFYLKNPKSKEETPIFLRFSFNYYESENNGEKKYVMLKYYTIEKINPKFWNKEKQRAKETKAFPRYSTLNDNLNDLESNILKIYSKCINDKIKPTPELLRNKLNLIYKKLRKPTKEPHQYNLFSYIEYFINDNLIRKHKNTIKKYRTTQNHLLNFSNKINKYKDIEFNDINLEFYNAFYDYMTYDLLLSVNTVGKYIKTLKTVLNDAFENKHHNNLIYKSKKFKAIDEATEKIYLTDAEITALYNLDLSSNKKLDKVRDLFIIGCYTALRFSDFTQIKKENITENGTILKIRTQKTDEVVYIPIHEIVSEILKKYDYSLPYAISIQKMNDYIKEVGKLAGIDTVILKNVKKGNLTIDKKVKKYELITTHTARRSGATNFFKSGIPSIRIMQLTGHRTEKAFMRYIRITQEENAKTLLNHDYFKRPLKIIN